MAYLLIVDDDADFASAMDAVLRSEGYETGIETDCEKTIDRIRERRPDAVILDVMFPENDKAGFQLARSIRRMFGELPLLLVTAVKQSFLLGFSSRDLHPAWLPAAGFVEKPVDFSLLCKMVSDILARAKGIAQQSLRSQGDG